MRKTKRSGGSSHSTRVTTLRAGYIVDPDGTRERIKAALVAHGNVERAAVELGSSERSVYRILEEDEALRTWWKAEQEKASQ